MAESNLQALMRLSSNSEMMNKSYSESKMPFSQSTYFMKMLSDGLTSNYHTSAAAAKSRLGANYNPP